MIPSENGQEKIVPRDLLPSCGGKDTLISILLSCKGPVTSRANLQRIVHLLECLFSLLEEPKDDGPGELAIVFVVVHLEDLLKCHGIDAISQIRQGNRALLALWLRSAFCLARHSMEDLTLSSASRRVLSGILEQSFVISRRGRGCGHFWLCGRDGGGYFYFTGGGGLGR
jgi:hypothetical protein